MAQLDGTGTNVVARFVYGSKANVPDYMVTSGGTYRILSDHLGSPRAVVDVNSGAVIETINFDDFGNETDVLAGTLPTGYVRIPFGFAGGLYDPDTQLVRFGARDYDASVGRWTKKDPVRFGGGMNLYEYVGNDPMDRIDRSGRDYYSFDFQACVAACLNTVYEHVSEGVNVCGWVGTAGGVAGALGSGAAKALGDSVGAVTAVGTAFGALVSGTVGLAGCTAACDDLRGPRPAPPPPLPCDPSVASCLNDPANWPQ